MSSGSAITTGPGRPDSAVVQARDRISGMRLDLVDLGDPLGDRAKVRPVVNFLERLAALVEGRHLADEKDHRRGILHGRVHADGSVGRTGPARDEAYSGFTGQLAVSCRHERCAAFVAAQHEVHLALCVVQRIEHGKIAFTGHAEAAPGAQCLKACHQQLAAVSHGIPLKIAGSRYATALASAHCDHSSLSARTRWSMSAVVCKGVGVKRSRSVPLGTVG
jgi:hypothetical protein